MTLARSMRGYPAEIMLAVLKDGAVGKKAEEIDLPVFRVKRKFRGDPGVILRLARLMKSQRIDISADYLLYSLPARNLSLFW